MKKLFAILLILLFTVFPLNNSVKAEERTLLHLNDEFTLVGEKITLQGSITSDDIMTFASEDTISSYFVLRFEGIATLNSSGDQVDYTTFAYGYPDNKNFGIVNFDITLSANLFINRTYYFEHFPVRVEAELKRLEIELPIQQQETKIPQMPDNTSIKAVINPTMIANAKTGNKKVNYIVAKSDIIYLTITQKFIKIEEDEGYEIVYCLDEFDDWIHSNVILKNSNDEELDIVSIIGSKNILNLKYGIRNATITLKTREEAYDTVTIPVVITYLPSLELDYTTRHTAKLLPINGALYSIDGETWQESSKFKGLDTNTEYTISVKAKNDTTGDTIQTITATTED